MNGHPPATAQGGLSCKVVLNLDYDPVNHLL